ncbi:hypothetical protein ACLBXO_23820 [Methylobacterium sp. C33D]
MARPDTPPPPGSAGSPTAGDGAGPGGPASLAVLRRLAEEVVRRNTAVAAVVAAADRGESAALVTLGHLYSPFTAGSGEPARNARLAAVYFERAAAAGNWVAGGLAAELHDRGPGNLERDPDRAAALVMRQIETDPDSGCLVTDPGIGAVWTPDFWAAFQRALAARGLYAGPFETRCNDATRAAVRHLVDAAGPAREPARP